MASITATVGRQAGSGGARAGEHASARGGGGKYLPAQMKRHSTCTTSDKNRRSKFGAAFAQRCMEGRGPWQRRLQGVIRSPPP
eukprot:scaffold111261_cov28-Tisochrysis_lutea.AAC.3